MHLLPNPIFPTHSPSTNWMSFHIFVSSRSWFKSLHEKQPALCMPLIMLQYSWHCQQNFQKLPSFTTKGNFSRKTCTAHPNNTGFLTYPRPEMTLRDYLINFWRFKWAWKHICNYTAYLRALLFSLPSFLEVATTQFAFLKNKRQQALTGILEMPPERPRASIVSMPYTEEKRGKRERPHHHSIQGQDCFHCDALRQHNYALYLTSHGSSNLISSSSESSSSGA